MISLEPYIVAPHVGIMKTLAPIHRKQLNQAAHAAAVRFEIETRDRWIHELTEALNAGETFAELQERIAKLAS